MVAILFLLTVIIFLMIDFIMKRKEQKIPVPLIETVAEKSGRPAFMVSEPYYHPTHTWARVTDDVVTVGYDEFTEKVFGQINKMDIPKIGSYLQQGQTAWKLYRGKRYLSQSSPVEGEVTAVNEELLKNPAGKQKGWILKIKPVSLRQNLKNLLHGETARQWLENSRAQFVLRFSGNVGPVCQDGGELIDNAGDLLTESEWREVAQEFFMSDN